jgi:hypothetical protein
MPGSEFCKGRNANGHFVRLAAVSKDFVELGFITIFWGRESATQPQLGQPADNLAAGWPDNLSYSSPESRELPQS